MLFPTLSTSLLGLATLAAAAPQLHSRFERDLAARDPVEAAARGLVWNPRLAARKNNNNNNNNNDNSNFITITELQEVQLTEVQQGQEVQLTEIVEEKLVIINEKKIARDNVRKNHFKNVNNNVNTVIIVVTQIIDQRDVSNVNTRYMTHQVQSNEEIEVQQVIIVSEIEAMTIDSNSIPSGTGSASSAQSTGNANSNIVTYDPSAAPSVNNMTMILPSGVSAPSFDNTQVNSDPAIIIEVDQAVFVSFVSSSDNSNSDNSNSNIFSGSSF